jgi:hypothetical protein
MSQEELNTRLREWCEWLFPRSGTPVTDPCRDPDGTTHDTENAGNPVYFVAGTWGVVWGNDRTIRPPLNSQLFVVAASAHATPDELVAVANPNLDHLANRIDGSLTTAAIQIIRNGAEQTVPLRPASTLPFKVRIPQASPYNVMVGTNYNTEVDMVCRARVATIQADGPFDMAIIAGAPHRPDIGRNPPGQIQYVLGVKFLVRPQ